MELRKNSVISAKLCLIVIKLCSIVTHLCSIVIQSCSTVITVLNWSCSIPLWTLLLKVLLYFILLFFCWYRSFLKISKWNALNDSSSFSVFVHHFACASSFHKTPQHWNVFFFHFYLHTDIFFAWWLSVDHFRIALFFFNPAL